MRVLTGRSTRTFYRRALPAYCPPVTTNVSRQKYIPLRMSVRPKAIIASLLSLVAVGAAVVHAFFPNIKIDSTTAALLLIAIAPWSGVFFKSLELPGGVKIEYHDLKAVEAKARDVGLIDSKATTASIGTDPTVYERIATEDPNLALAGLRIEIERALVQLGANRGITATRGPILSIARQLTKDGVLPEGTVSVLSDLLPLLNKAVHGAQVDPRSVEWALSAGAEILAALKQ